MTDAAIYDGFETVAFCEIEPFPRKVLAKHWPEVPIYDDVRTLTAERLAADGIAVDVICGGFPCQDISTAGKGAGLAGERSGLWSEIARLAGELRPQFIIVENVAALLGRGLGDVLGDLAALGYDAEWHCIPAAYVGAPHRRDRVWIIAHPSVVQRNGCNDNSAVSLGGKVSEFGDCGWSPALADTYSQGLEGRQEARHAGSIWPWLKQFIERRSDNIGATWRTEPDVGRVANGVPDRAHRLKGLGNAVVPQIPELIGNAILAAIQSRSALSAAGAGVTSFSPANSPAVTASQGGGLLCDQSFHASEIDHD